jgi:hypothetical protein
MPAGLGVTAMTRLDHALEDLHLPGSPIMSPTDMREEYRYYRTPGWRQLLCAWFIILTAAALFEITDLTSADRSAPFAHATNLAQTTDVEQTGDIETWEQGVPR